jgi:hypothetical protein
MNQAPRIELIAKPNPMAAWMREPIMARCVELRLYRSALEAESASQYMGTASVVIKRTESMTGIVGLSTTSERASTVMAGAATRIGFLPMASASLPKEDESITSANAEAEPIWPSSTATAAASIPESRSAGGRAVPTNPKHAL